MFSTKFIAAVTFRNQGALFLSHRVREAMKAGGLGPLGGIRQTLGFFIGEPPINPFDPAAAIATSPP